MSTLLEKRIMDIDALYNDDSVEDYEYPWQYLNNR